MGAIFTNIVFSELFLVNDRRLIQYAFKYQNWSIVLLIHYIDYTDFTLWGSFSAKIYIVNFGTQYAPGISFLCYLMLSQYRRGLSLCHIKKLKSFITLGLNGCHFYMANFPIYVKNGTKSTPNSIPMYSGPLGVQGNYK